MNKIDLFDGKYTEVGNGQDPIGRVYIGPTGQYYRGINIKEKDWISHMQRNKIIETLQERNFIPAQEWHESGSNEFGAVLSSRSGDFNVHVSQYPLLAIKDAALKWININKVLASIDPQMGLIDGHYLNFAMFSGVSPRWVDIGSISTLKSPLQGVQQFLRYFVVPLMLLDRYPERSYELRRRIRHPKGGLTEREISDYGITIPDLKSTEPRNSVIDKFAEIIEDLKFSKNRDFWSTYRPSEVLNNVENGTFPAPGADPRFQTIAKIVRSLSPDSVIDIGANDGLFSFLVSQGEIPVLSIDTDEFSLNKLCRFVHGDNRVGRAISAACAGFRDVEQQADVVMALALTHHLVLSQKLSFEDVAAKLATMARRAVLTEYMPDGLGGTRTHPAVSPNPLPNGYSLDVFLSALRKHFTKVEVIDYGRVVPFSQRTLILCQEPIRKDSSASSS